MSVRVALTTRIFSDHLRNGRTFQEASNEAYSDHTKMDVVMPTHVVTRQVSTPVPATAVAFPGTLATACLRPRSSPVRTTVQVAGPSPLAQLSATVSLSGRAGCAVDVPWGERAARRKFCGAHVLKGERVAGRTCCEADVLQGGRVAGRTGCGAEGLRGGRAAGRTGCEAHVLRGGRAAGRTSLVAHVLWGGMAAGRKGCGAEGLRGARAAGRTGCGADELRGGRV